MTAVSDDRTDVPAGGLATWSPSVAPPIGVELSPEQELACAFRILAGLDFGENIAGHITWADRGDGSMLVNPWGLWWEEITAADICRVDEDAQPLAGRWDVTPAIHIHTELHRRRPDARVVVHNHPFHATVLAALGVAPGCFHQTGSMFDGDVRVVHEYTGEVDDPDKGGELAELIGDAPVAVLATHGVIVTGATVAEATYRSANFERLCRLTVALLQTGGEPMTVSPRLRPGMKASLLERGTDVFWAGAVRQLLRREPEVLATDPERVTTMADLEELQRNLEFTRGGKSKTGTVTFLPEPPRAERELLVISVDDHIVEPPDAFTGRLPSRFADAAPRVVERPDGTETWLYDGQELPNVGFNAVAGRPVSEYSFEPARFDEMRRGAWDIDARIADMDLAGVWASLCFPSFLPGFTGQRLQLGVSDPDLALAAVRAWNDWNIEAWSGAHPDRMIPLQLPWLLDPQLAADEIRRNAARGFKAVTFSEGPDKLGLPSLHSRHWDPIMAACEETDTVVCVHVGSSGTAPSTAADAPPDVVGVLFFGYAMMSAVDWLYSLIPVRYPNIKICMSEGGIGWVAGLLDRLDHVLKYHEMYGTWTGIELTPREVLQRNFWFCAIDDRSGLQQLDVLGPDHVLLESDYPHADSSWPHTQRLLADQLRGLPADHVRQVSWENASRLFRHPVPAEVIADPNAPWPTER